MTEKKLSQKDMLEQNWHYNKLIYRKQLKWLYAQILCEDSMAYM